jgi:hypothetical protein
MNHVTLNPELRQQLGDLSRLKDLRDESGRVVACIVPMTGRYWVPPFTQEELDREVDETTEWYSSEQFLDHLKKLEERQ